MLCRTCKSRMLSSEQTLTEVRILLMVLLMCPTPPTEHAMPWQPLTQFPPVGALECRDPGPSHSSRTREISRRSPCVTQSRLLEALRILSTVPSVRSNSARQELIALCLQPELEAVPKIFTSEVFSSDGLR